MMVPPEQPIDPNKVLTVALPAAAWNAVLQLVMQGPFAQVAALVQDMQGQLRLGAYAEPSAQISTAGDETGEAPNIAKLPQPNPAA